MKALVLPLLLAIFLTHRNFIYNYVEADPDQMMDVHTQDMIERFMDQLKKSPLLFYKIHEFDFHLESWTELALYMKKHTDIERLKGYSKEDFKAIFVPAMLDKDHEKSQMRFYVVNFEMIDKDLFQNPKDWRVKHEGESLGLDEVFNEKDYIISGEPSFHLTKVKPKSQKFDFEFLLGEKFKAIRNQEFRELSGGHLTELKNYDLVFSNPRFEFLAKDDKHKIKYQCYLHTFENKDFLDIGKKIDGEENEAFSIVSAITEYVLTHVEILKTIGHKVQLTYRYQDIVVVLRHHIKDFGKFIQAVGSNKVKVDAFGVLMNSFTNPHSIFSFDKKGNLKNIQHGMQTDNTAYMDMTKGGSYPETLYDDSSDGSTENLEKYVAERINIVLEKVANTAGILETDLTGFRKYMVQSLKEDFRKFRENDMHAEHAHAFIPNATFHRRQRTKNNTLTEPVITPDKKKRKNT